MRYTLMIVVVILATTLSMVAGTPNTKGNLWSATFKDDAQNGSLSKDGAHLLVYHGDTLLCLDVPTGKRLWTRPYKDVTRTQHLLTQFTKPGEAVIAGTNSLIWVDLANGKELASVPVIGEVDDMTMALPPANTEYDTIQPVVFGDLMVVWYSDGTQVIDLPGRKVLYQSKDDPSKLKMEKWFSTMMIDTESDTTIFVDGTRRAVVYKHDNDAFPLSTDLYQRFFEHKDLLVVLTETNMIVVDKNKAAKIGTLLVSPEKTENFIPIVLDDKLYVLATLEESHQFFDVASQKMLWSIPRKDLDGIMDQTTLMSSGDMLVQWFDEKDFLWISKVSPTTGKVAWSTRLVEQEGGYEAGHIKASNALATIASYAAASMLNNMTQNNSSALARRPYNVGPGGILTYNGRALASTIDKANLGNETMSGLTSRKINRKRKTNALLKVVGVDGDRIHVLVMGEAHQAWKGGEPSSNLDGEGLLTLDASTGKVVTFSPQQLFAKHDKKDFNLYLHGETVETSNGLVAIGASSMCHATNKGAITSLSFDTDDLQVLDSRPTYVVVYCEDKKGDHQLWYVDCSTPALKRTLMMYSDDLCEGVTKDTTDFRKTITLFKGTVKAYQPLAALPTASDTPVWTISEAEIDKMGIGSFDADSIFGTRHGVRLHGEHVFFLGDDGMAIVDQATGACRQHREWDASFKFKRDGVVLLKNAAYYQFDDESGMIGLKSGCDVSILAQEKFNHLKGSMLLHRETGTCVIVNSEENTVNAYRVP